MSWLMNVMAGDSRIKHELLELAERAKDESLSLHERLEATYKLGLIVQSCEQLQAMVNELDEPADDADDADDEPKYVWRNGAKVKVK